MKKALLTTLIVLFVLVSCATNKSQQAEVEAEVVEATVVEQVSEEPVLIVEDKNVQAASETPALDNVTFNEQLVSGIEIVLKEEPAEKVLEPVVETVEPEQEPTDWSHVFTSTDVPASEEIVSEQTASETPAADTSATEEKKVGLPASEKPKASAPSAPAEKPSVQAEEEAGDSSFIEKAVYFLTHETLFSIGLLVCLAGLVYFIVALIIGASGKRNTPKKDEAKKDLEPVPQDAPAEEDEEDEFLKALLGEDKK